MPQTECPTCCGFGYIGDGPFTAGTKCPDCMPRIEVLKDHRGHVVGHVATVTKEEQEEADKRAADLAAYYKDAANYDDWIDW